MWGILFTAIWSGIKAFFGKSDQEKLGIAEITVKQQANVILEVQNANTVHNETAHLNDAAVHDELLKYWAGR